MITIEQIQKELQNAINCCGVSQTKIAEQIGVKQQQISSYLKGKTMPALDTLANLCKVLDLDANEILCIK